MTARWARAPRLDYWVVGLVALAVRLPAYFAHTYAHPDDATFGMSIVAMRHGGVPFRDVFSSQGPLHLPLLYLGDLIGLRTSVAPRTTPMLSGVVAALVVIAIGRRLAGRAPALAAGVVVAVSGSLLWVSGPATSDGPSIALSALGFLLVLRYADAPSWRRAVLAAVPLAAAVLIKPATSAIAVVGALAIVLLSAPGRRVRDLATMAATAVVLAVVSAAPFGISDVWDQSVRYQLESHREASIGQNVNKIVSTMWSRDILLLALCALAIGTVVARRRGRRELTPVDAVRRAAVVALAVWAVVLLAFLVYEPALWRNHLSNLIVPGALLAACARPSTRALAVVVLVVMPVHLVFDRSILHPAPFGHASAAAERALRALPPHAQVVTDEIGLVWRAGLRTPDDLVDSSIKRFEQHRITTASTVAAARRPAVCAVLVWRAGYLGAFHALPQRLAAEGYTVRARFGGARVLYERDCRGR